MELCCGLFILPDSEKKKMRDITRPAFENATDQAGAKNGRELLKEKQDRRERFLEIFPCGGRVSPTACSGDEE